MRYGVQRVCRMASISLPRLIKGNNISVRADLVEIPENDPVRRMCVELRSQKSKKLIEWRTARLYFRKRNIYRLRYIQNANDCLSHRPSSENELGFMEQEPTLCGFIRRIVLFDKCERRCVRNAESI